MASLGTSFGTAAADYERGRPGYLPDAVAWLLAGVTGVVADVGAGTGKLTAEIVAQGFEITAIDPDEGMLAALADHLPQVPRAVGTAESLPLADGSCGAVTLGQAWHWVDVFRASAEIARVLVPGGVLGLIWNVRDESVPWVAALGAAMGASAAESLISSDDVDVAAPFGEVEERIWHWQKSMSRNDIRAMVRSRSYYIAGDEGFKRRVDGDVDTVLGTLADGPIQMPYATYAYRALRP